MPRAIEGAEILRQRLSARPMRLTRGWQAHYEMLVLSHGDRIIGVRDHVVFGGPHTSEQTPIYQAHIFVVPAWRGTGLAAWLRALPLISASWWQERGGLRLTNPVLVAEIDRPRAPHDDSSHALRGYLHAGYGVLPPDIDYLQPNVQASMTGDWSGACSTTSMHLGFRFVGCRGGCSQNPAPR